MSTRETLLRYIHIINKLRKAPTTFDEIDHYLLQQSERQDYKFNVSKRQFQRDLKDIGSIFEIEISYDFSKQVYSINEEEYSEISHRRMEAFDTFNALKMGENTSRSIHLQNRRPLGTEHLFGMLHAIKNNLQIQFNYHKYWEDEPSNRTVEPLALKEFKNRWYVVANNLKDSKIKSFALDRLSRLEITKKHFKFPEEFDINEYYKHYFGIISPEEGQQLQAVILSFDPFQGKYIKSLPLHESQEILQDNDKELLIRLTLFVTHDFLMEILSFGGYVKVIQPVNLIEDVKTAYRKALKRY
jgi:predicted DNA-binding transcriptional regulator YafY